MLLKKKENILNKKPNIVQMTRAPFFSSVLAPLIIGTLIAVIVSDSFNLLNFILVIIMGVGLHTATNVYNDIYDTFQGTDKVNVHRNEFSGGSGVLVDFPELLPKMFWLARGGLILALFATIGLSFLIDKTLLSLLAVLYLLSAFFSKYYTAAPFKLAYRGLGEISVWFAFGPMAILDGAVSQSIGLHSAIIAAMPLSGLSTLSILWIGQMIDLDADKSTGKLGMVSRIGTKRSAWVYLIIQILIVTNIVILPFATGEINFWIYLPLLPYLILLPKIFMIVVRNHSNADEIKPAAKMNVMLHLVFSLFMIIGLLIQTI